MAWLEHDLLVGSGGWLLLSGLGVLCAVAFGMCGGACDATWHRWTRACFGVALGADAVFGEQHVRFARLLLLMRCRMHFVVDLGMACA